METPSLETPPQEQPVLAPVQSPATPVEAVPVPEPQPMAAPAIEVPTAPEPAAVILSEHPEAVPAQVPDPEKTDKDIDDAYKDTSEDALEQLRADLPK